MAKRILICVIFLFGIFLLIGFSQAQCSLGKWGGSCQYNCSESCYEGSECISNGGKCGCDQIVGHCFGCPKDFHGDFCTKECGANCSLSDPCLQSGIACGCHQQYGSCNSCPSTSWGDYCERTCSDKCISSECGRSFGNCTSGCIKGFYGANCNQPCPLACLYGCDQITAECFLSFCVNCKGGYPNCDTHSKKCKAGCIDGFFGDSCDKSCEEITNTTLCTKCTKLPDVGITVCSECQSGYYSDVKQCKLCSTSCNVNSTTVAKCFPNNGHCRFGCTPGWSGDRCDTFNCAVGNCDTCVANQPTVCATCQTGWYLHGGQCTKCSDNCATTNQCDKVSGACNNGCKTGWYGIKCIDSCTTNCIQGECDGSGMCTQGCNGKRYGQKCDSLCSNCLTTCNRISGVCDSTCINGYYGSDCSLTCPSNCLNNQCNKGDGKCSTGCKSGYYGNTCAMQCSSNCDGNVCAFVTGACSGTCASGKYGDYCDLDCPIYCSPTICQKSGGACSSLCEKGYYGSHCNIPCPSSCSTNECSKIDGTCTGNCPSGKYGTRCELTCSSNCNGTTCGQTSGTCSDGCIAGYYGNTCHEPCTRCDSLGCQQSTGECIGKCLNGYYGNKCDQTCSIGCNSSSCEKNTGGCGSCKDGFYGEKCTNICSNNCKFTRCLQTTGLCSPEGCVAGQYGPACDVNCADCTVCDQNTGVCQGCVAGKYGINCENDCSQNCRLSASGKRFCDGVDGYCLNGCNNGWYGSTCSIPCNNEIHCIGNVCDRHSGQCTGNCVNGWYGNICNMKCSDNCNGNICDRLSGTCTQNCTYGFYGTTCTIPCHSTCTDCDVQSGVCTKCKPGYHDNNCTEQCSVNCFLSASTSSSDVCNKDTGICNGGCKDGWYGQTCGNQCSPNCLGNKCALDTGKCDLGCQYDKYGEYCDNSCTNCAGTSSGNCNINSGRCLYGCEDGYFGNSCTQACYPGCKNKKCFHSMNNCSLGCQDGLYGPSCSEACNTHCVDSVCVQSTGRCSTGCDPGWFGETCKYACPDKCAGSVCDRVAGTCVDVCTGSECEGTTIKDDTEVDLAIIIGASVGGLVAFLIIIIIICCHCLRTRNRSKGGSEDILTPRSDSLVGIDNHQFDNFHEIKKDDWVMRNTTLHYEHPKQNGVLLAIGEADAQTDYYDFPPPPAHAEDYVSDQGTIPSGNTTLPPPPPEVHFADFDGRDGIQVEMFPQYVEYMLHKENAFENEYKGLPYGLRHPYDVGLKVGNKRKNRYKNIYAYDHSRVVLVPELDTSDDDNSSVIKNGNSDYINASYFDGYHNRRAYITCQGPTDEMVDDFWRMIWQHRIQTVVMLTKLVESGEIKCKKYWPDENKTEKFGNIYVKFDYQEIFADFILTNLIVTKDNARLQVKHLQFTSWPDKDVPKYVTPLVEFYCKVTSMHRDGSLLVHCSAGVGRSGTFIGLDFLMDQADTEGRVNIYKCVEKMRIARVNMVQTSDQYIFLHQALSEALQTSESPVDEDEFENYYNQMLIKDPRSGLSRLQQEFTQLKAQKVNNMFEAATMEENIHRNRRQDILASDECRVFLWSKIKGCTDYINAIYLPSFRNKYCFIAAEMPQCSTIVDFCRMIFQEEVRTIVMLDNESSGINVNEHYWPNPKQTMECGPFSIKVTEEKEHEDYTVRSMNFKFAVDDQNGTYKVNQFHYKRWSEGKVTPTSVDSFLNFVRAVTEWQSDSVKHPIIVHCLDGATKLGLFCIVRACLDRLESDGDVSVIHTLHHIRARRHQIMPNYEQYKFCHDCILKQITTLDL